MDDNIRKEIFETLSRLMELVLEDEEEEEMKEELIGKMRISSAHDMYQTMVKEKLFDIKRLGKAEDYALYSFLEVHEALFEYYVTYESVAGALKEFGAAAEDVADYLAVVCNIVKRRCDVANELAREAGVMK